MRDERAPQIWGDVTEGDVFCFLALLYLEVKRDPSDDLSFKVCRGVVGSKKFLDAVHKAAALEFELVVLRNDALDLRKERD